jgi:hypothetical protein
MENRWSRASYSGKIVETTVATKPAGEHTASHKPTIKPW